MAVVCTEYDRDSFLEEYSPLILEKEVASKSKIIEFRRRCFSDMSMTNNPLSRFRQRTIKNKINKKSSTEDNDCHETAEDFMSLKRSNSESRFEEKKQQRENTDSGYFSIDPDKQIDFNSPEDETKWNDFDLFLKKELHPKESAGIASSVIKKGIKFLQSKSIKTEERKAKNNESTQNIKGEVAVDTDEEQVSKTKRRAWKKAKKRASAIVRFIKRNSNNEDKQALIRAASVRMSSPAFREHFLSEQKKDDDLQTPDVDNSAQMGNLADKESMKNFSDDLFVSSDIPVTSSLMTSPIKTKYITPNSISRLRPLRARALSMYLRSENTSNFDIADSENDSTDFIAKYLNRSKSLEDLREIFHEKHQTSIFSVEDPFADFEPDVTVYCKPKETCHVLTTLVEGEEHEEDDPESQLTPDEYNGIVEEEVDRYILHGIKNDGDNGRETSFSYSVNDLYELFNRKNLLNTDCNLHEL